jgi:hypothetical protein
MPSNDDLIDYDFDNPEDYREIDYDSSHNNPILGMVRSSSSHPISFSFSCLPSLVVIYLYKAGPTFFNNSISVIIYFLYAYYIYKPICLYKPLIYI